MKNRNEIISDLFPQRKKFEIQGADFPPAASLRPDGRNFSAAGPGTTADMGAARFVGMGGSGPHRPRSSSAYSAGSRNCFKSLPT